MPSTRLSAALDYEEGVAFKALGPVLLATFEAALQEGPPPCHLCPLYGRWQAVGDLRCSSRETMPCLRATRKVGEATARMKAGTSRRRITTRRHRVTTCGTCGRRFTARPKGMLPRDCPECTGERHARINRENNRRYRQERREAK